MPLLQLIHTLLQEENLIMKQARTAKAQVPWSMLVQLDEDTDTSIDHYSNTNIDV